MTKRGHCIICHRDNQIMSDEHVIPDAVGGYLHIYSVCAECNSRFGTKVDNLLIDNWLTKIARNKYHLAGHSGNVPHPLTGEGVMEDGRKVRLEIDEKGRLIPYLIPSAPQFSEDGLHVSFSIDSRDMKYVEHIKDTILKRKKLDGKKYVVESSLQEYKIDKPCVHMQTSIDIKNYLLALLKIAYEFTATCCPTYEKDPQAELYAEILAHADKTRIDEISVVSNHFMDREFSILAPYVGNNEYRHILLLTEIENKLVCVVKLFDTYGVYIRMSDSSYGKGDTNGIIAINDFKQQKCDIYTIEEVLNRTLHGTRRDYVLSAESQAMVDDILQDSKKQVGFACVAGQNLLFDSGGKQIGTEEYFLLQQDKQSLDDTVITNDGLVSTYHYPENYYYMLMPQKKLIRVDSIKETILVEKI